MIDSNTSYDMESDDQFAELSTTLQEIDESLNQEDTETLSQRIYASSEFLRELLIKQKKSHQKIQLLQDCIQKKEFAGEGDEFLSEQSSPLHQFHSTYIISEKEVNLNSSCSTIENSLLFNDDNDNEDDVTSVSYISNGSSALPDDEGLFPQHDDNKKAVNIHSCFVNGSHTIQSVTSEDTFETKEEEEEDYLLQFFDYMAAHIKMEQLEKERIKLDVLVALKTKLQSIPGCFMNEKEATELNEKLFKILVDEIGQVKTEEEMKSSKQREYYQLEIDKLTQELETVSKENCEVTFELHRLEKQKLIPLQDSEKLNEKLEMRVTYLENLLRSIEIENEKYKTLTKELEAKLETTQRGKKVVEEGLVQFKSECNNLRSSEEMLRNTTNEELRTLVNKNSSLNDKIFILQNQVATFQQEKDGMLSSKQTDLAIIKHLEEKLENQKLQIDRALSENNKKFAHSLEMEKKASGYKQKLKNCVSVMESVRSKNKTLIDNMKRLEHEKNELHVRLNDLKIKNADLVIKHAKNRTDLEEQNQEQLINIEKLNERLRVLEAYKQRCELKKREELENVITYVKDGRDSFKLDTTSSTSPTLKSRTTPHIFQDDIKKSETSLPLYEIASEHPYDRQLLNGNATRGLYSTNDTKLFLREMTDKLHYHSSNTLPTEITSPLQQGKALKGKVDDLHHQVMAL